jgi:PAS domain S-box-containing protein
MTTKSDPQIWKTWWKNLIQPSPTLDSADERQQARLLSALLLTLIGLTAIIIPLWFWYALDFLTAPYIAAGILVMLVAAYGLSRTRHYRSGATLLVLSILLTVIAVILTAPEPDAMRLLALQGLAVAAMVAILFLRRRFTLLVIGICLAIMLPHFFVPDLHFTIPYAYLVFFIIITGLAAVTAALGEQYKRDLAASEERYRALFQQAHDAVFILDLAGRHIEANQRAADLLGYTLEEVQQLSASDITAEPAESEKMLARLLAGEYLPVFERLFRRQDGSVVPVEIKAELVFNSAGQPLHIQSVVRDISEHKAREQQLRLQSAALEAAANAIMITDCEGHIQWSNAAYTRLTGYAAAEAQGKNPRELVRSGLHDDAFYKEMWDTILAGQIWQGKLINRRKDGTLYTEEQTITPVTGDTGTITHFVAVKQDITEREKAAAALRQSEARQRALLTAMPDLMFRNHRDGTFLDYHAGNENQLAVPPEQFLGHKTTDVLPPELAQYHMYYIEQVLRTGKQAIYEYTLPVDGQTHHFEARMVPAGPDEVLSIVRDITRQKRLQAQALELVLEKERANLLRQFVQNASHELRTPLSVINTDLYLITRVNDEQKRRYYAERSQRQIMRLTHLLDMTLTMTKLDSEVPFTFRAVDINGMVEQLVSGVVEVFSDKGGDIQFTADPTLPECRVDVNWLQEAIRHLIDNAIRFTPAGGQIKVSTRQQNQYAVIEVRDNGIGISEQTLPHIFERFWRQDEAHSTPGFGLGLSIVQKIIEMHNGHIEVDSEVGQGSRFRLLLPLKRNKVKTNEH